MNDKTKNQFSFDATASFSEAVLARLHLKERIGFQESSSLAEAKTRGASFVVATDLIEHEEISQRPTELSIGIFVRILDIRGESPELLYQEVIAHTTLLPESLTKKGKPKWKDAQFRTSPLGLAHAKLSREVATYIEDYISLAMKRVSANAPHPEEHPSSTYASSPELSPSESCLQTTSKRTRG